MGKETKKHADKVKNIFKALGLPTLFSVHTCKLVDVSPDGNTVTFYRDETKKEIHRWPGPAIFHLSGKREYYFEGKQFVPPDLDEVASSDKHGYYFYNGRMLHRVDGPAVNLYRGFYAYYQNDKRHRLDGPAVIHEWGDVEYWIDGVQYESEYEFKRKVLEYLYL